MVRRQKISALMTPSSSWGSSPISCQSSGLARTSSGRSYQGHLLSEEHRGGQAYAGDLEARAKDSKGAVTDAAREELRRGWCLGEKSFAEKVLEAIAGGARPKQTPSLPDADPRSDRLRCGGRESKFLAVMRWRSAGAFVRVHTRLDTFAY